MDLPWMHAKLESELVRLEPRLVNDRNNPDGTCRSLVLEIIAEHTERTGRQEITLREIQQAVRARGAAYSPNTVRQVVARDMAGRYTNYTQHVWYDLEEVAVRTFRLRSSHSLIMKRTATQLRREGGDTPSGRRDP